MGKQNKDRNDLLSCQKRSTYLFAARSSAAAGAGVCALVLSGQLTLAADYGKGNGGREKTEPKKAAVAVLMGATS